MLQVNVVELNPHAPRPFVFTELAQCLHASITACGYASTLSVNQAQLDKVNLVVGAVGEPRVATQGVDPTRTIIYNAEQLGSDSRLGSELLDWLAPWTVADYHGANLEILRRRNGPSQRVFMLPPVPMDVLRRDDARAGERTVDVLLYGSLNPRREALLRALESSGLRVDAVAGAYGEELAPALQRSRLVVHVHFYETGLFPAIRFLQPVANEIPIVCESSVFSEGADWRESGILFADYEELPAACCSLLQSPWNAMERAILSRRFARRIDFRSRLDELLRAVLLRMSEGR